MALSRRPAATLPRIRLRLAGETADEARKRRFQINRDVKSGRTERIAKAKRAIARNPRLSRTTAAKRYHVSPQALRPSFGRAVESRRTRIGRLTDDQVVEQFQLRLRQVFPNSENYENSFRSFDTLPDLARVLSTMSDNQLRTLIVQREGADFNMELAHMMRVQIAPVMVTKNPLHYHDSSRTDYGI